MLKNLGRFTVGGHKRFSVLLENIKIHTIWHKRQEMTDTLNLSFYLNKNNHLNLIISIFNILKKFFPEIKIKDRQQNYFSPTTKIHFLFDNKQNYENTFSGTFFRKHFYKS